MLSTFQLPSVLVAVCRSVQWCRRRRWRRHRPRCRCQQHLCHHYLVALCNSAMLQAFHIPTRTTVVCTVVYVKAMQVYVCHFFASSTALCCWLLWLPPLTVAARRLAERFIRCRRNLHFNAQIMVISTTSVNIWLCDLLANLTISKWWNCPQRKQTQSGDRKRNTCSTCNENGSKRLSILNLLREFF